MNSRDPDLVFLPLGGVGEIGMNLSAYGFGPPQRRRWLIVDVGVSFAEEEHVPGIDLMMPDVRFLEEERRNLVGIVLTHAHEDHFGALIDLWPKLKVPVYATPFTAGLLAAKCASERGAPQIEIVTVPVGGSLALDPFAVDLVPVAHSIPESHALVIRTPLGAVVHTGDWKIDETPGVGLPTDVARLRAVGDAGVLALMGDSTNAVRDGRSPSEADVAASLKKLIAEARGRVAVTTFASNVARLRAVSEAARACDREVVLVGRAMERVVAVARETGHLDGVPAFRGQDVYGYLPPDKVVALCTGSQGEARAALARIAQDDHPAVTLSRGDRVIFSSRTIPGNEKAVSQVINGLVEQGIDVITDRTHLVHVSGHPRRDELREMFSWIRPQIMIPVHGEALHLFEHAALAREAGVPQVLTCRNGDMVRLAPGRAGVVDEVASGRLYKDGQVLVLEGDRAVIDRKRLSFAGIAHVSVTMNGKGMLATDPMIDLTGIPEIGIGDEVMQQVAYDAIMETLDTLPRPYRRDPDAIAEALRRALRSAIAASWGKKPLCRVHVMVV